MPLSRPCGPGLLLIDSGLVLIESGRDLVVFLGRKRGGGGGNSGGGGKEGGTYSSTYPAAY